MAATRAYLKAIELTPDDAEADAEAHYNLLRAALNETGQLAEAIAAYCKAIEFKPDDAEAHCKFGWALLGIGQLSAARAEFLKAIKLNPAIVNRWNLINLIEATIDEEIRNLSNNKVDVYTGHIVGDKAKDLNADAAKLRLSYEEGKSALEWKASEAGRETAGRAKEKSRQKWERRKGTDANLSPAEFVAKHYATEMAAGVLHRGVIAREDPPLHRKLANWLRTHTMPDGVDIPTKPEWITRRLTTLGLSEGDDQPNREVVRLVQAVKERARVHRTAQRVVRARSSGPH